SRKKWIREMDESLQKLERSRTDRITAVLRSCTLRLEEISYFLPPDVHRLLHHEAMVINRALLANQRAMAQLLFKLLKSELKRKFCHQLKWQDAVKAWKLIQKTSTVQSFRQFMAKEEIQNP
ncbi:CC180 protein, partial [Eubucco bourcierii]|nr:CC180 protein [Eubucco bourcierii]